MSTRTLLSRKAKVDARERLEDEKLVKKQIDAALPTKLPKKPKGKKADSEIKEISEDEVQVEPKANGKPTSKVPPKKKATKTANSKSKTDDDMEVTKPKPELKRRSRSAEPSSNVVSKKKLALKETIPEEVAAKAPAKKGRVGPGVKKQAAEERENDEAEKDPVAIPATIRSLKKKTPVPVPEEEPLAKKVRGTKAAAVKKNPDASEGESAIIDKKPATKANLQISNHNPKAKKMSPQPEDAPAPKKERSTKAAAKVIKQSSDESESDEEAEEDAAPSTAKAGKTLLNNATTDYDKIDFSINQEFNFKIVTWNVAGLRALLQKNSDYFAQEDADIICLNEVKCGSEKEVPAEAKLEGYHAYWNIAKGAGGVGLLSKTKPIEVSHDLPDSEFDDEKRLITAEYEKFYLVSVYVVNSGRGLKTLEKRLKWNEVFDSYIKSLDKEKPVIIAGDLNVSHQEIDLTNPKPNKRSAGFTQEERDGFTKLLSMGFVDTFRHFYPDTTGAYTFWNYITKSRPKNVGWRLDYFVVSERFMEKVKDNVIRSTVMGSDHCPIVLFLDL